MWSDDVGQTWSAPTAHATLSRMPHQGGRVEIVPCDLVPAWHAATGKVLALGHTACYAPGARHPVFDNSTRIYASYSVCDPRDRSWSQWKRPNEITVAGNPAA